jgi:hypothetical protein
MYLLCYLFLVWTYIQIFLCWWHVHLFVLHQCSN